VGVLGRLSGVGRAGISMGVRSLFAAGLVAVLLPACDVRPLRGDELFGAPDASVDATVDVAVGPDVSVDATVDIAVGPDVGADASADGSDAVGACGMPCASDQLCDELTGTCVARTGPGILSGVVFDKCGAMPLGALVGIAGRQQCSFQGKGAYFFNDLPLGKLTLAAALAGYDATSTTIEIVPGGVRQDLTLTRTGAAPGGDGCDVARPQTVCTCTAPTCSP
jgi:hypothetical protein